MVHGPEATKGRKMRPNRIISVYFSATGTTRKVVSGIADKLSVCLGIDRDEYGFTKPARRISAPSFGAEDLVVFGTPVYAGRVPNVLIKFIEQIKFDGSLVVPVVLYGNRNYDDALKELAGTLKAGGGTIIAAGAFIGEHAFSRELAKGRPDESDMKIAEGFASDIAEKVQAITGNASGCVEVVPASAAAGSAITGTASGCVDIYDRIPGEEPLRPYFKPRDSKGNFIDIRKVTPVTSDACDGCGICVEVCPMGSIDPLKVTRMKGICIKCSACVKRCPRGAKYFDDEGFIYHKEELEKMYKDRKEPELFL